MFGCLLFGFVFSGSGHMDGGEVAHSDGGLEARFTDGVGGQLDHAFAFGRPSQFL